MWNYLIHNERQAVLLLYFSIVNILSFFFFALDKIKAERHQWRISENTLLLISFLGGATGALTGMVVFKHKLSKKKFALGIPILLVFNRLLELFLFANLYQG